MNTKQAIIHIEKMINDGADIIDIGASSSRPFSKEISLKEEKKRLKPILNKISKKYPDLIISIDGQAIQGKGIEHVVNLIRGKVGTEVSLGSLRGNKVINLSLFREIIDIQTVTSRIKKLNSGKKIAYIRLKQL